MKFSIILSYSVAAALLPGALAWPGMSKTMGDLSRKLAVRQDDEDENDSDEMIGDLVSPGPITPVGQSISRIIVGDEDGFSDQAYIGKLPGKNTKACAADTCCIWSYIASDLTDKFTGKSGRCNGWARAAIRQGFHDAGAWSKDYDHGGADGSLILAGEISRAENHGLEDIISWTQTLYNKYSKYGIGMADLIQFMANTATVTCPLGPRVRTYIGRIDNSNPAPNG